MRILIIAFLCLMNSADVRAQVDLDSLWEVWSDTSRQDMERLIAINQLEWNGFLNSLPDSAIALTHLEYAFAEKVGEKNRMARALNTRGVAYRNLNNYSMAIKCYNESLHLKEEINNREGMAATLVNIGVLYKNQDHMVTAIEYQTRGLKIYQEIGQRKGEANALNNIGLVHYLMGDSDAAMDHYARSLRIRKEINASGMAASLHNIGSVHRDNGDLDLALEFYGKSLRIDLETNNRFGEAASYTKIGELHLGAGDIELARTFGEKGLRAAQEVADVSQISGSSGLLYKVYKRNGQIGAALEMHELHLIMRDSFNRIENQREVIRHQYRYEYEKQAIQDSLVFEKARAESDLRIEKQDAKLLIQRIAIGSSTIGLFLIILLTITVIRGKQKSDDLLLNILPEETVNELKETGTSPARFYDSATVLFTDFKGFTLASERMSPKELLEELNQYFMRFDVIMEKHGLEKIKTIGDSFMAAGGLPVANKSHAADVVKAGIEIRDFMLSQKKKKGEKVFEIRIGIHTGPVVAGIVGIKKFAYDIWGDTVNTASRMESSGAVGKVNISEATYELVKDQFNCEYRGEIEAKGKGKVKMYFVTATKGLGQGHSVA